MKADFPHVAETGCTLTREDFHGKTPEWCGGGENDHPAARQTLFWGAVLVDVGVPWRPATPQEWEDHRAEAALQEWGEVRRTETGWDGIWIGLVDSDFDRFRLLADDGHTFWITETLSDDYAQQAYRKAAKRLGAPHTAAEVSESIAEALESHLSEVAQWVERNIVAMGSVDFWDNDEHHECAESFHALMAGILSEAVRQDMPYIEDVDAEALGRWLAPASRAHGVTNTYACTDPQGIGCTNGTASDGAAWCASCGSLMTLRYVPVSDIRPGDVIRYPDPFSSRFGPLADLVTMTVRHIRHADDMIGFSDLESPCGRGDFALFERECEIGRGIVEERKGFGREGRGAWERRDRGRDRDEGRQI